MGVERQHGSKRGGGYVGGFLQLFDWNAKSRKKLFSSKSDSPEHSKQKKRGDGNLPMTRYHLIDEEINVSSSFKGSSSYSCASSMTDDEECSVKAPSVVARLMGLDPLPPPLSFSEFNSTPFHWSSRNHSISEPKNQKAIEKFQTEILPPKSAKSIPITHHKLLSPIKSGTFIPPENAAQIMQAAARIIEPQVSTKPKMPLLGSSSVPLKVKDLKDKVEASQKPTRRSSESNASKYLKPNPTSKSIKERASSDPEESFGRAKSRGKSISLALQAKANVLKREGLMDPSGGVNVVGQKESSDNMVSDNLFKNHQVSQRNTHKKQSAVSTSNVLRQNNQKQNCLADRGKSPSKPLVSSSSQGKRTQSGESSHSRHRVSSRTAENSKISSRRMSLEASNDKKEEAFSGKNSVTRKKRPIDGEFQSEKNPSLDSVLVHKSGKLFQSSRADIVSFTFNAPLTSRGVEDKASDSGADYRAKKMHNFTDRIDSLKLPLGRGNDLSTLLEQKLKELTEKVEQPSSQTFGRIDPSKPTFQGPKTCQSSALLNTKTVLHDNNKQDPMEIDDPVSQHHFVFSSVDSQELTVKHKRQAVEGDMKRLFDHRRFPSPISVLEHSYFAESCNFSDTDSNTTPSSMQSSSIQAQDFLGLSSLKRFHAREADAELLDSASSSTSTAMEDIKQPHLNNKNNNLFSSMNFCKSTERELEYVKEIIGNLDLKSEDLVMARDGQVINHYLFDQLESRKGWGSELRSQRKVMFECVSECLESMCRMYFGGGYETWAKGVLVIEKKERLVEEVYREITGWSLMRDSMVDELVDKDMSTKCGKWLDFETEAFELGSQIENRLLNSLLDEVINDLLVL